MKPVTLVTIALLAAVLVSGCASQSRADRLLGDAAAVGGASTLAYSLSDGNPVATIGAGVAALGVKTILDNKAQDKRDKELKEAYDRGVAQALKTKYWAHQDDQARDTAPSANDETPGTLLPITAPERVVNGVIVRPSTEYIRVDAPPSS